MPGRTFIGPSVKDVHVSTLADHEEFLVGRGNGAERGAEIVEEEDIAIYVADGVEPGHLLRAQENGGEEDGAEFVALDLGLVAKAEFAGGFRGAFIGAKENDFDVGMKPLPALDGVPLDDVDVALEGFRNGEEGKHRLRIAQREDRGYRVG